MVPKLVPEIVLTQSQCITDKIAAIWALKAKRVRVFYEIARSMVHMGLGQASQNVAQVVGRKAIKHVRGNVIAQPLNSAGAHVPDWGRPGKYGHVIFFHVPLMVVGADGPSSLGVRKRARVVGG